MLRCLNLLTPRFSKPICLPGLCKSQYLSFYHFRFCYLCKHFMACLGQFLHTSRKMQLFKTFQSLMRPCCALPTPDPALEASFRFQPAPQNDPTSLVHLTNSLACPPAWLTQNQSYALINLVLTCWKPQTISWDKDLSHPIQFKTSCWLVILPQARSWGKGFKQHHLPWDWAIPWGCWGRSPALASLECSSSWWYSF